MNEYSVKKISRIFGDFCEKNKYKLKHVLLLSYNPHHIQRTYTLQRIAENNFEAKTKLVGIFEK